VIASTTTQSCESAGSTQGPEFVRRSKEMAERDVQASHRLGPILVTLAGDRAIAQLVTIIDIPFKLEGIDVTLSSHTRLLLRAERREGVWRLSGFDPVYLRDEIVPMIPGQTVAIDPGALKSFTDIPVLPNVKTACSRRGIVALTRQPSPREGHHAS